MKLPCTLLLWVIRAQAQNTAEALGTVTDNSGGVIPDATVTRTNTGTNISQTAQTSGGGGYAFTLLQVPTYAVKVEAKGFKTFVAPNIALSSGDLNTSPNDKKPGADCRLQATGKPVKLRNSLTK